MDLEKLKHDLQYDYPAFLSVAWTTVPKLIADVERLRAELAAERAKVKQLQGDAYYSKVGHRCPKCAALAESAEEKG